MTIQFRPATRGKQPVFFGLAGPTSSGKTFSALRFATGLAQGGKVYMIDTESGRGEQYADDFKYDYGELNAPFTPEAYLEAINDAKAANAKVIIVDSTSHMHDGPGGMLEQHEEFLDQRAGQDFRKRERMNFSAWIGPKQAYNKFRSRMLQLGTDTHIVFCFRAKNKLKLDKKVNGQIPQELEPITPTDFEYEMTTLLVLPAKSDGVPDLSLPATKIIKPHRGLIRPNVQIDESLGAAFAEWANGKAPEQAPQQQAAPQQPAQPAEPVPDETPPPAQPAATSLTPEQVDDIQGLARQMAGMGKDAFNKWWADISRDERAAVTHIWGEIVAIIENAATDLDDDEPFKEAATA